MFLFNCFTRILSGKLFNFFSDKHKVDGTTIAHEIEFHPSNFLFICFLHLNDDNRNIIFGVKHI